MRLTRPSTIVFTISLVCAVLALLSVLGIAVVSLQISSFWTITIAWALITTGVLLQGM